MEMHDYFLANKRERYLESWYISRKTCKREIERHIGRKYRQVNYVSRMIDSLGTKSYQIGGIVDVAFFNAVSFRVGDLVIGLPNLMGDNTPPFVVVSYIKPVLILDTPDPVLGGFVGWCGKRFYVDNIYSNYTILSGDAFVGIDYYWFQTPVYYRPFNGEIEG